MAEGDIWESRHVLPLNRFAPTVLLVRKTTNTSVHAMRIRPFARIKQAEETPTRLPILFFEWTTKILRNSWNNYILAQAKHRWSCTRKSLELEGMAKCLCGSFWVVIFSPQNNLVYIFLV